MQNRSAPATFLKGFMGSAGSGALMTAIFYPLMAAGQALFASGGVGFFAALGTGLLAALPMAALMIASLGIFGGIMALKRAGDASKTGHHAQHTPGQSQDITTPVMVPALGVQAEHAPEQSTSNWAERVGTRSSQRDHIQQILDRDGSAKDRASALLAERESAASNLQR